MAVTIQFPYITGKTVKFAAKSRSSQWMRSNGTLETYNASNLSDYKFDATEEGVTGSFKATLPTPSVLPAVLNILAFDATGTHFICGQGQVVIDASNNEVSQDLAQLLPTSLATLPTGSIGEALVAARAQGIGKWAISGTDLILYFPNGSTVLATITLAPNATSPTSRTPQ